MADQDPYIYTDRRLELPMERGTVPFEQSQLGEILAGVRVLLARGDRIMEDAQRQIQGNARRMQIMLDASQSSHNNTLSELEDLKAQLRLAREDSPMSINAWREVIRIVDGEL